MRRAGCLGRFVALGVAALLSAACTRGSATPNLSPVSSAPHAPTTATSTPTPTAPAGYPADVPLTGHNVKPGEKPPRYPAAAAARTQAGANAFAEFFLHTWDWAYATTNPSYMKHYYGPTCGLCKGITTGIAKTAKERHWYEGGRFNIHSIQATGIAPVTAPAEYCSTASIDASAQTVVDARGTVITGEPPHANIAFKLCMHWTGPGWQVAYWARR
jgi:hypothetical protein